jgi:DNA-binding CsgD family transcriptional regulator
MGGQHRELLSLIPSIYDAAQDPALWPETLNRIASVLQAVGVVFTIEDLTRDSSNMTVALGIDPLFQRLYNERYESLNLHLQRARPLLTPGRVLATHQLCSDQETLATEYYHDFLRPQEDRWFHIVGGCVAKERSLLSVLSFMRGRRAGHYTDREIKFLEILMPHLRRAAKLHQTFSLHENIAACLDSLPTAAMLVNDRGQLQFANRAAREVIQRNDGIGVDKQGHVTSTNRRCQEAIRAACHTATGGGPSSGVSLLVFRTSGKPPYSVSVSPIRTAHPFSTVQCSGAAIFIGDPDVQNETLAEALGRLFHLTPAEARLASFLVEGRDLTEICGEVHIRRTTARTHLARIRDKLGVKRQAEIVSVIMRTVSPLVSRLETR